MNGYIQYGLENGLFSFNEDKSRITYVIQKKSYDYAKGSEEEVRAITYAELVSDFAYKPKNILFEVGVQLGSTTHYIDIVVLHDKKSENWGKIFLVIELKKEDTKDTIERIEKQVRSYALSRECEGFEYYTYRIGNANNFVVFNENEERVAHLPYDYNKNIIYAYVMDDKVIPLPPPKYRKLKASTSYELRQIFNQCHDIIWDGGAKSKEDAFNEFAKLLFLKMHDELIHEEKHLKPYIFQLQANETAINLLKRVEKEYTTAIKERKIDDLLEKIYVNPYQLEKIVGKLEAISLIETDNDPKGLAYETFVKSYMKGEFGQFFTPRNIVEFMLQVSPILWDDRFDYTAKILDPCCGSGSFLIHAISEFKQGHPKTWKKFANNSVYGIEKRDKTAVIAKVNIALHDDGHNNVYQMDGLNGYKKLEQGNFSLILTNPPFGVKIKNRPLPKNDLDKRKAQDDLTQFFAYKKYDITAKTSDRIDIIRGKAKPKKEKQKYGSQIDSEVIFFELYHKMLKEGGIVEVVIPDGLLSNSSMQKFRDWLMEHFQILAVISLPDFTFNKYDAGVKTSILILKKFPYDKTKRIQAAKYKYLTIAVDEYEAEIQKLEEKLEQLPYQYTAIQKVKRDWNDDLQKMPKDIFGKVKRKHIKNIDIHYKTKIAKIKKKENYKTWLRESRADINAQIKDLKITIYDLERNNFNRFETHFNYPIFMAIAKHIGYDATGRDTKYNDLNEIAKELKRFLIQQQKAHVNFR
ncbi:MAG: restriction endonuclease subunit M [Chitinophagales bacterium]